MKWAVEVVEEVGGAGWLPGGTRRKRAGEAGEVVARRRLG